MPFKIIKKRFMRKLLMDGYAPYAVALAGLLTISVVCCFLHAVVMGVLVIPVFVGLFGLQLLIDEHTERKEERELAERRKRWEANAPQRAFARAIMQAIQECPPDADDAYRQKAVQEAAERFRRTCDTPLPEFLGAQVDGHFIPAIQH